MAFLKKKSALLLLLALSSYCFSQEIKIYVSTTGNDNNAGTLKQPLATLQAAKEMLRKHNNHIKKTVFIRGGVYNFSSTFALDEKDGGTKQYPVTYTAYKNEQVFFTGSINIPYSGIKKTTDPHVLNRLVNDMNGKLYEASFADFEKLYSGDYGPRGFNRPYIPSPNELFINNQPQTIARWPNEGDRPVAIGKIIDRGSVPRNNDFSSRGATFEWNTDRPQRWQQADDIWISGLFNNGYADDVVKIATINHQAKTFTTAGPHLYGFDNKNPWNTWVAHNLLEEIDRPGEYYIDKKTKTLYLYPLKPITAKDTIQLSVLHTPIVALEGVSYLTIDKIIFEATRGMALYIEGGEGVHITNSIFRNIGMTAIVTGKGVSPNLKMMHEFTGDPLGREVGSLYAHLYKNTTFNRNAGNNHLIADCDFYNIGSGAIILGGGDRISLIPGNNTVRNCVFHDFNRLDKSYRAAVNIDGVGNKIQHCLIYNAPGNAIYLHGNNHIIEYNEIHHVMMDGDDQAAYYLGRDPSEFNNTVRYNYFHHIGLSETAHSTWTIYYDDGACGSIAHGNVFYKAGKQGVFLIGGGKYNKVYNNVFINNPLAIHEDDRMNNWSKGIVQKGELIEKRLDAVKYNQPPYSLQYPELVNYWKDDPGKPQNLVEKNIIYKTHKLIDKSFLSTSLKNNWHTNNNPGFADEVNGNFSLLKNAAAFKQIKNFEAPPFLQMGLLPSAVRKMVRGKDGRWLLK